MMNSVSRFILYIVLAEINSEYYFLDLLSELLYITNQHKIV